MKNFPGNTMVRKGFGPATLAGMKLWLDAAPAYISFGGARRFTAANSEYFTVADHADFSTGDVDFWISAWVRLLSTSEDQVIVAKGDRTTAADLEYALFYKHSDARFRFSVSNGSSITFSDSDNAPAPVINQWNYVLAWHDATANTINLQVNNNTVDPIAYTLGSQDSSEPFQIGADTNNSPAYNNSRLALVAFGKPPATIADQITEIQSTLFNNALTGTYGDLSSTQATNWGLKAFYGLNEVSGNAIDETGNHDLTDTNTVTAANGPGQGFARDFEVSNDEHFTLASHADFQGGSGVSITVAAWVKCESQATHMVIASKWNNGNDGSEWKLEYRAGANDKYRFIINDGTGNASVFADTFGTIPLAEWHYIVAYYDADANSIGISVNNTATDTTADSDGMQSTSNQVTIGRQDNATSLDWDGLICRIGIWKRILTAAEKSELYNLNDGLIYEELTDGLKTSLSAYWNGIEDSGNLLDSHTGSHDCTDVNSVLRGAGPSTEYQDHVQDGDTVRIWKSREGSDYYFFQTAAGARPVWRSGILNNKPVLRFDGTNDLFKLSESIFAGTAGSMIAYVIKSAGTSGDRIVLSTADEGAANKFAKVHATSGNDKAAISVNTGGTADEVEAGSALGTSAAHVVIIYSSGSAFTINIDGSNGTKAVISGSDSGDEIGLPSGKDNVVVGAIETSGGVSGYFDGDIAEILVYEGTYTTDEISKLSIYLQGKYGV